MSSILVTATFIGRLGLFYSKVGGCWTSSEPWPEMYDSGTLSKNFPDWIICICSVSPEPNINDYKKLFRCPERSSLIYISDFLAMVNSVDDFSVKADEHMSRIEVYKMLSTNYKLIEKYRRAGPYREHSILSLPQEMLRDIDQEVKILLEQQMQEKVDDLEERVQKMPGIVIDAKHLSHEVVWISKSAGRKMYQTYILPLRPKRQNDTLPKIILSQDCIDKIILSIQDGIHISDFVDIITKILPVQCPVMTVIDAIFDVFEKL